MKKKVFKKIVFVFFSFLVMFQGLRAQGFDPTADIARGCYTFATSGVPELAVNGDNGNRWESGHGSDDQWWYVDLGNVYELNLIQIRWEGAYGKTFNLLAANEIPESGQHDADWEIIYSVTDEILTGFPNEQEYNVDGKVGRYIKFQGIERGTQYGYSFYAFRVYAHGLYVDADDRVLETVIVSPNPVSLYEGEETRLLISALCNYGGAFNDVDFSFQVDDENGIKVTEREGNYYLQGLSQGEYDLTVIGTSTDGNNTVVPANVTVTVLERQIVKKITLTAPVEAALIGRPVELSLVFEDQFGVIFQPEQPIEWKIEGVGEVVDNSRYISMELGEVVLSVSVGDVESESVHISCVGYDYNLALKKPIEAIGELEAFPATFANDGNKGTRWVYNPNSVDLNYEAWITVDLESTYQIDLIEILWEGAVAADYEIYYSLDNEDFGEAIYAKTDVEGLKGDVFHQFYTNRAEARYIKIFSSKAATQYGVSIWELSVFGSRELKAEGDDTQLILSGTWNQEAFAAIDNVNITSYDMSQVIGLVAKPATQNPNCLIFLDEASSISGEVNVITGTSAERIVLRDGYPYASINEFTAMEAEYTRDFTGMNGWATLYVPFDLAVDGFTVEEFASYEENAKSIYFKEVETIAANTPYILKVNNQTGEVTFRRTGTTVFWEAVHPTTPDGSNFTFKGTYTLIPAGEQKLVMKADGSEFAVTDKSAVGPFRGYLVANDENYSMKSLSVVHGGEDTTNIVDVAQEDMRVWGENGLLQIISAVDQTVYVYTTEGRLVGKVEVNAGYNAVEGLTNGIYIINNQKVIIR